MNIEARQYGGHIRFHTETVGPGETRGMMPVQEGILNPFGTVHAGALIWFADVCATRLALQGVEPHGGMSGFPLSINMTAQLLQNVTSGTLMARSSFVRRGRTIQTVRTEVKSDTGLLLLDLTSSHVASRQRQY